MHNSCSVPLCEWSFIGISNNPSCCSLRCVLNIRSKVRIELSVHLLIRKSFGILDTLILANLDIQLHSISIYSTEFQSS